MKKNKKIFVIATIVAGLMTVNSSIAYSMNLSDLKNKLTKSNAETKSVSIDKNKKNTKVKVEKTKKPKKENGRD